MTTRTSSSSSRSGSSAPATRSCARAMGKRRCGSRRNGGGARAFIPLSYRTPSNCQPASAIMAAMGCVLVREPDPEVRELVTLVARRIGHEAVTEVPGGLSRVDAVVVEPESFRALLAAQVL